MTTKKGSTKKPAKGKPADAAAEVRAFAYHLSEALRISRTSAAVGADIYNALGEAWNDITNNIAPRGFYDSPEFVACIFEAAIREEQEGGAK